MKSVQVVNQTRGTTIAQRCEIADNLFTRVRGLLGRTSLDDGAALLITPCPSIHMFGMKFALDVIFLTHDNVVTDFVEDIAPGKIYAAKAGAGKPHAALELAVGTIARTGTQVGDQLVCEEAPTSL